MPIEMFKEKSLYHIDKIIAIAAGKGGVGKSTLAVNIALALQILGEAVGILDADLYGPSLVQMLPCDQMAKEESGILYPAHALGLRLLSMGHFGNENKASAMRAPLANKIIEQFLFHTAWGQLNTLVIDFPPGTGDIQMTLAQKANLSGALMVSTPQEISVMDVRKAIHLFKQFHVPILGLIENMSYLEFVKGKNKKRDKVYLFGQGNVERLAQECAIPFLGSLPLHPLYSQAADEGISIFKKAPHLGLPFLNLARAFIDQIKKRC